MPGRLRTEVEPLHREEEGSLGVEGNGPGDVRGEAQLADREDVALMERRQGETHGVVWDDLPPTQFEDLVPDGAEVDQGTNRRASQSDRKAGRRKQIG